jgi:poly(3-hydroxybutyrate) depolymerase
MRIGLRKGFNGGIVGARARIAEGIIVFIILLLFIGLSASACGLNGAVDPSAHRFENPVEYFLYVPEGYSPDRRWPLFVGIHGAGGSGTDCWSMWQPYAESEGFVLLCPSIADESGGWYQNTGEAIVADLLNRTYAEYSIKTRVFLAGFSAGAQFVQGFAFKYPSNVGGVAVLSSGNYYAPNAAASSIPFLVVIGDEDDATSIANADAFASLLQQHGYPVEFHILEGVGHSVTKDHKDLTIDLFRRTVGSIN